MRSSDVYLLVICLDLLPASLIFKRAGLKWPYQWFRVLSFQSDDTDGDLYKLVKDARKQNGQGAAEGPNNVKRLPEIEKLNQSNQRIDQNQSKENITKQRQYKLRKPPSSDTQFQHKPKCTIESKDALSAIVRARTQKCKQEIADVACKEIEGTQYKRKLPRYCPLKGKFRVTILGIHYFNFNLGNKCCIPLVSSFMSAWKFRSPQDTLHHVNIQRH